MSERLFAIDELVVPLVRPPRRRKSDGDARFRNDYPPEWDTCPTCGGHGAIPGAIVGYVTGDASYPPTYPVKCPDCLGMGSLKAKTRLLAGHRCERCNHPYIPSSDAAMLGVETRFTVDDGVLWSPCDEECRHGGLYRYRESSGDWVEDGPATRIIVGMDLVHRFSAVEAAWRILTVHHLDGDKANCRWWNLATLCQRCHLEIQSKVVMEQVYPHEHSEWFKPHAAGYYAAVYLDEPDLSREEVAARMGELLALELATA